MLRTKLLNYGLRIFNKSIFFRFPLIRQVLYNIVPTNFKLEELDNNLFRLCDDDSQLYVTRRGRISMYREGINVRLLNLQRQYLTNSIKSHDTIVNVVDIGANIGEWSLYWKQRGAKVIAIEPDPVEFRALEYNLGGDELYNVALWFEDTELQFYPQNDTGDSSAIPNNLNQNYVNVKAKRLDSLLQNLSQIDLIKIEAEGAEPEVLKGARETLTKTKYIQIDVGLERGLNSESTLVDCTNILYDAGFVLLDFNPKRYSMLFLQTR